MIESELFTLRGFKIIFHSRLGVWPITYEDKLGFSIINPKAIAK